MDANVLIRQLQDALAGRKMRAGTATLTWPGGSQTTDIQTVTHGLGATPTVAIVSPFSTTNLVVAVMTATSTQITIQGATRDESSPAAATARTVHWVVFT